MFKNLWKKIKEYFSGGWINFIKTATQGMFASLPFIAITWAALWLYDKTNYVTGIMYSAVGIELSSITFLWTTSGLVLLFLILYSIGHFFQTRIGVFIDKIFEEVPGYNTIKKLVNLLNSDKLDKKALVVVVKGYHPGSYVIGLMNSQKESIIKGHYTVSINMSPLPNGGFMGELPASDIYVIRDAGFDHNLKYLLSMGTVSFAEVMGKEPAELGSKDLPKLKDYLEEIKKEEGEKIEES